MAAVAFRGTTVPVVLPKLRDPRLHLAATITSLQVLGQVAFSFRLSIAQILLCLGTTAVIEIALVLRKQRVLMWPASALLTGNGVAFVLRVPGTQHGDWWTLRGWWIFVVVAAGSLLSKHVLQWRGEHFFNPSNIGLVVCFLALGRARVEPLDFWWGPMSWWMALTLAIIVTGGFAILRRLHLLRVALGFWAAFALATGVLALAGHAMTARWHLGPISGFHFWWVLVTSPEVLVFLFFMITDPKTAPAGGRERIVYSVTLGLLAGVLIAPTTTEFAAKVALLASLAVVCAAKPLLRFVPRRVLVVAAAPALAFAAGMLVFANGPSKSFAARPLPPGQLPRIAIQPSPGVQTQLDLHTAQLIAHDLVAAVPATSADTLRVHLVPGTDQGPPTAVAQLAGRTYRLVPSGARWRLQGARPKQAALPSTPVLAGFELTNESRVSGLGFRQGSFRYGMTNDEPAMMTGGACVLDYNGDGWEDLFVVNSYADDNLPSWDDHGGLPRAALYENVRGRFVDVSKRSHADVQVKGEGCVAGDLDGDGRPDIYVTTATDDVLLWNNGDGRPDLFVAGYADKQHPIQGSLKGFPRNYPGVRDELFLNLGHRRFREVGAQVGLDPAPYDHSLGAELGDVNGDGRPDLIVANDEDPNRLYLNEPGGPLGFRFVDRARSLGVADANAGMGIANAGGLLFVSNSRGQTHAVYRRTASAFEDVRTSFAHAFGTNLTGWGDSWVDLRNDGSRELVLANGGIPVTNVRKNAAPLQVLARRNGQWVDTGILRGLKVNGRGLVAADFDNDGRVDVVVNALDAPLVYLHNDIQAGNWLEVSVEPFSPGAVVTVTDSSGRRQSAVVHAGSSYLSSEDPRAHFGFGRAVPRLVTVRYPDGTVKRIASPAANAILTVTR